MSNRDDHREKNILLAKNLNEVKMDLRCKKQDVMALKMQLRLEQQRNSKLASEQMSIVTQIDRLKKELEETFVKNTFGYIHLSKQLDQMHEFSIQKASESCLLSSAQTIDSTVNSAQSSLLAKIKTFTESMQSNTSLADSERVFENSMSNESTATSSETGSTSNRLSISYNSFEDGLNTTFIMDSESDSELNQTFLNDSDENQPPPNVESQSYVTVRKGKKIKAADQSKVRIRTSKNQSRGQQENQLAAAELISTPNIELRRGCRSVKRVDYNERSFRRNK